MPITLFDHSPEIKQDVINTLTSEIEFLFHQIKKMKKENDLFEEIADLGKKFNQDFSDTSKSLRYIFHFIGIQAYENNNTIKGLIDSYSEADDLPLMKKGIIDLQEGCKRLIGFYIIKKDGSIDNQMIEKSLLFSFHNQVQTDHPELYAKFESVINDFRNKLEANNIKDIRCELVHYQNSKGDFNPFNFSNTVLELNVNEVYDLLFDYYRFLKLIAGYVNGLMNMGYR